MKKFTFLLTLFLMSNICFSQFGWYWSHPSPTGSHLEDVFFNNLNVGYAVGWDGTIIKTTNAGYNWIQLNSGGNRFLTSVYFINIDTGFVVSGDETRYVANNILLKTTNAGSNWLQIYTIPNTHLSSIYFINQLTGFIVGGRYWIGGTAGGRIFKTTNCGANWEQYYPDPTVNYINSICFTDSNVGYVAGDDGRILKTTNTGLNWYSLYPNASYTRFNSIYFINSFTGFAGGAGGLYKTTNEGVNWYPVSTGLTTALWDIEFKDLSTGFITAGGSYVEVYGKVIRSTDAGNTWNIMNTNSAQNYRGVSVVNNNVVAVGYWGTVVRSSNNGNNWIVVNNAITENSIKDAFVFDSLNCIATGDSSKVLRTTTGGDSWQTNYLGGNYGLNSIYFVNSNTGYISGGYSVYYPPAYNAYYAKIYKTTSGGSNWFLVYGLNGEQWVMYSIKFLSSSNGLCVGGGQSQFGTSGTILKTTNAGVNWVAKNYGSNECLYSVFLTDSQTAYVCGSGGKIYKTTNSGDNWVSLSTGITSTLFSIDFPTRNVGFASSYNQVIKTTNEGLNWAVHNVSISYEFDIKSITFLNNNLGFAVGISFPDYGRAGDIIGTTDGGLNWGHMSTFSTYPSYQRRGFNSIRMLNYNVGYIMGEKNTILKTTIGGGIIGVSNYSNNIPQSFSLSQNYPNPFNPVTKIKYQIPLSRGVSAGRGVLVRLIIFDILGREIETLVNETQRPGSYEVTWDGNRYASGVYFYRLITDDFTETRKMVLIK